MKKTCVALQINDHLEIGSESVMLKPYHWPHQQARRAHSCLLHHNHTILWPFGLGMAEEQCSGPTHQRCQKRKVQREEQKIKLHHLEDWKKFSNQALCFLARYINSLYHPLLFLFLHFFFFSTGGKRFFTDFLSILYFHSMTITLNQNLLDFQQNGKVG